MHRSHIFIALLFLIAIPLAADTLDPSNVVIANPRGIPLVVDAADVSITPAHELAVRLFVRNTTTEAVHTPQFGVFVMGADHKPVMVASIRSDAGLGAKKTIEQKVTIPLPKKTPDDLRVLLVPVAVSLAKNTWQADRAGVLRLVDRVRQAEPAAQFAIARDEALLPRGELVQLVPPNCTLAQCRENDLFCQDYCGAYAGGGCPYCDRRRTGDDCTTVCYCMGAGGDPPCPPNPFQ